MSTTKQPLNIFAELRVVASSDQLSDSGTTVASLGMYQGVGIFIMCDDETIDAPEMAQRIVECFNLFRGFPNPTEQLNEWKSYKNIPF